MKILLILAFMPVIVLADVTPYRTFPDNSRYEWEIQQRQQRLYRENQYNQIIKNQQIQILQEQERLQRKQMDYMNRNNPYYRPYRY